MSLDAVLTVEMDFGNVLLDSEGTALLDSEGYELLDSGFLDITADVRASVPVNYRQGNSGNTIFDRVADIGACTFMLNNATTNANATLGYYSPDNSARLVSFGLDSWVRITITDNLAAVHEEWQGKVSRIAPDAGQYGRRGVMVTAQDWMAEAQRQGSARGISVQASKRDDQVITTLLALAQRQPIATDIDTGDDTYVYACHDENSDDGSIMRIFQKLAMSGFGKIFVTGYDTLTYLARSTLLLSGTPAATLSDSMRDLRVSRDKARRVYRVNMTAYPAQLDSSNVVLWASQKEIEIAAGATVEFDVHFRDPSGRATRVAANSLVAAVAGTDYNFSSVSGSGSDLNANMTVGAYTAKSDITSVSLTNTAGVLGYMRGYQIRGKGLYLYEPQSAITLTGQDDGETLTVHMIYQDDVWVAADISQIVASWYAVDQSDIGSLTFVANRTQALMDAAFLPVGSLVSLSETVTGISNNYLINGRSVRVSYGGKHLEVTWYVTPANQLSGVCILDLAGSAELDSTAYLAG